jgi:hypothetical protein
MRGREIENLHAFTVEHLPNRVYARIFQHFLSLNT